MPTLNSGLSLLMKMKATHLVLLQGFGELDGICTFCEMAVPLATRLAEKLGLPGNTPAAVDAARDKFATRQKMQEAGLPTPRNYLIKEPKHVQEAANHVGFPAGKKLQAAVMTNAILM